MPKRKRTKPSSRPTKKAKVAIMARPNAYAVPATRGYRLNRFERKVADIAPGVVAVNKTGSFSLLACPVPGTDMTNRIGRKVLLKTVYIKGSIEPNWAANPLPTTVTIPSQEVRMILFVDYQPNGAAPATTDLLTHAESNAHLNLNNRDRFKVLADKVWELGPITAVTTAQSAVLNACGNQIFKVKLFKRINVEMVFNAGSAGSIADVQTGALYMFWIGSTAASATFAASAGLASRVRFVDT